MRVFCILNSVVFGFLSLLLTYRKGAYMPTDSIQPMESHLQKSKNGTWGYSTRKVSKPKLFFGKALTEKQNFSFNSFNSATASKDNTIYTYWLNDINDVTASQYRNAYGATAYVIVDVSADVHEQCIDVITVTEHAQMIQQGLGYHEFRASQQHQANNPQDDSTSEQPSS